MAGIRVGIPADRSSPNSSNTYLHKTIDAYYFVLYVIAHSGSPARWWPVISLASELLQFSTFLLSPIFHFGQLTQSYTGFLDTFSASKPMSNFMFELQLWGYAAIAGIVLTLSIIIMRNYHSRMFGHVWALRVLMYIAFFLKLITSSSVTVFVAPLVCDPATGMYSLIADKSCSVAARWDWIIVGGVSFAIIYPFLTSFSYTSLGFVVWDQTRATSSWSMCTSVRFRLAILVNVLLVVLARQLLFVVMLPQQPEYLALVNFVLMLGLFSTLVTSLPYHSETMNKAYGGLTALLLWMASCALVSVLNNNNGGNGTAGQDDSTRWIDVVLLLGMPIATIAGVWIVGRQLSVAMEHVRWIHDEFAAAQAAAETVTAGGQPVSSASNASPSTAAANSCPVMRIHEPGNPTLGGRMQPGNSPTGSSCEVVIPRSLVSSVSHIVILIRIMMHQDLWSTAVHLAREAANAHPGSAQIQYLSAWLQECLYKRTTSENAPSSTSASRYAAASAAADTLPIDISLAYDSISKRSPGFGIRFLLFKRRIEQEQRSAHAGVLGAGTNLTDEKLGLLEYVVLQKSIMESQRHHVKCISAIQQFWIMFLTGSKKGQGSPSRRVSFSAFQEAIGKIIQHTRTAQAFYVELVSQYPNATQILKSYSEFARLVLNDPETADIYAEMARAANQREEEFVKAEQQRLAQLAGVGGAQVQSQTGIMSQVKEKLRPALGMAGFSRNAVVTVNAQGMIEHVNEGALVLFGYDKKNDLRGRKITTLMPYPYKTYHDHWMDQYRLTGDSSILGHNRETWGLHSKGWAFRMMLQVVPTQTDATGPPQFIGLMSSVTDPMVAKNANPVTLLINQQGIVQLVTKHIHDLFGYRPSELVGRNISMLMPKDIAALHDSFLSRYVTTGVSSVVGAGGRNFEGVTKSGSRVPVSIAITQESINGTVFFKGLMVNALALVGEAFMDASGLITDCNEDLLTIFGQSRGNIVGKSPAVLMPEPYRTFHDMFVARYQRTRKGTAVSSPGGKFVPAQHRDGSVFTVNISIRPLEQGPTLSDKNGALAYRATIRRVSDDEQKKLKQEKSIVIDASGAINSIGSKVMAVIGSTDISFYLDRPASILFPPLPKSKLQSSVLGMVGHLTRNSNDSFIAYLQCHDRTVIPVSITAPDQFHVDGRSREMDVTVYIEDLRALEGLVTLNWRSELTKANVGLLALFGYPIDQLLGQPATKFLVDLIPAKHFGCVVPGAPVSAANAAGEITFMMRLSLTGRHRTGTTFPIWFDVIRSHHGNKFEYIGRVSFAGNPEKVSELEREMPAESAPLAASDAISTGSLNNGINKDTHQPFNAPPTLSLMSQVLADIGGITSSTTQATGSRPMAATNSTQVKQAVRVDPLLSSEDLFSDAHYSSSNLNIPQPYVPRTTSTSVPVSPIDVRRPSVKAPSMPPSNSLALETAPQDHRDSPASDRATSISKPLGSQKAMRFSPSVQSRLGHGLGDSIHSCEMPASSLWRSNSPNPVGGNCESTAKHKPVSRSRGGSVQGEDSAITAARKGGPIMGGLVIANTMSLLTSSGTIPSVTALAGSNAILSPRMYSSLGRHSILRAPSPLQNNFDSESTTAKTDPTSLSVANESTTSRAGYRESRIILTWRASRFNPLHRAARRKIQFGFLILLTSTVAVIIAMSGIQEAIQPSILDDLSVVSLFNEVSLHSELLHFCHQAASSLSPNLEWAQSICTQADYRSTLKTLSLTLASLPQQLFALAHKESIVAQAVQTPWNFDQFISPDPMVATKVVFQDFWEITARVASSCNASASIVGDPTLNRHWRFLVTNKGVVHQAASEVARGVLVSIESDLILSRYMLLFTYAGNILVVSSVFYGAIFPGLRHLHFERARALTLLLQVPRSVVAYMVQHVYTLDEELLDVIDESDDSDPIRFPPTSVAANSSIIVSQLGTESDTSDSEVQSRTAAQGAPPSSSLRQQQTPNGRSSLSRATPQQPQHKSGPTLVTQTISVNPAQPTAIKPFIKVTILFIAVVFPPLVGMGLFMSHEMRTIRQNLAFLSQTQAMSVNLFKFPALAFEGIRAITSPQSGVSSVWDAQQMQTMASAISSHMNAINGLIVSFEGRATFSALLTYPFGADNATVVAPMHGVTVALDFASIPSRLRHVQSSQGLAYLLAESTDAISALAVVNPASTTSSSTMATTLAIPTALGQIPTSIQASLAHAATVCLKQVNLGLELFFRLNMMAAVTESSHVAKEVTMIHGGLIGILVVVFSLLWLLQGRMREEIKQNCVLLLMIPPSFLRSQRPIMHYLREVCAKLRKHYPDLSAASKSTSTLLMPKPIFSSPASPNILPGALTTESMKSGKLPQRASLVSPSPLGTPMGTLTRGGGGTLPRSSPSRLSNV